MNWLAQRRFNYIDAAGIAVVSRHVIQGETGAAMVAFIAFFGLSVWVENRVTKK